MKRFLINTAYEGTRYHGWQGQKNAVTIQGVLEDSLSSLLKHPVAVTGASRTDAGVHARGQKAVFDTTTTIPAERLPLALASYLPEDIVVTECSETAQDFHPRAAARGKLYCYRIWNEQWPDIFWRRFAWHIDTKLDIAAMKTAARAFVGEHDFASFCAAGSSVSSTVRRVYRVQVVQSNSPLIEIWVSGNGFLYKMIRIMAGTLVEVGLGRRSADSIAEILAARDRQRAGTTAPPHGLTLEEIWF